MDELRAEVVLHLLRETQDGATPLEDRKTHELDRLLRGTDAAMNVMRVRETTGTTGPSIVTVIRAGIDTMTGIGTGTETGTASAPVVMASDETTHSGDETRLPLVVEEAAERQRIAGLCAKSVKQQNEQQQQQQQEGVVRNENENENSLGGGASNERRAMCGQTIVLYPILSYPTLHYFSHNFD